MSGEDNLQRMKTLDDAWNAQDWEVFRKRHSADTAVFWPGVPEPTRGREAHQAESEAFFKSIENKLDNNLYKVMVASGDWTCTSVVAGIQNETISLTDPKTTIALLASTRSWA